MKHRLPQLDDLPDEILMHILKQLHNIEVVYYLIDVNQRLKRIAHDPKFTSHLSLLTYNRETNRTVPSPDIVLDRFCSTVLPQIGYQVRSLCLEGTSIKPVLNATNYPNLYELGLYDIEVDETASLLLDQTSVLHRLKKQISSFSIKFSMPKNSVLTVYIYVLFTQILTNLTKLKYLKFNSDSMYRDELSFYPWPPTVISSTLYELHVLVTSMEDCLYLLDGRFDQLRVFYVKIFMVSKSPLATEHKKKLLPNLRVFSLDWFDKNYNFRLVVLPLTGKLYAVKSILPLLHRMINLEELHLNIAVESKQELVDGNTLREDIISHLPRLHKFTFSIYSIFNPRYRTVFPSNEYIQKTFEDFYNNQIIACIDHFPQAGYTQCHIYSYPYQLSFFNYITNNFAGGRFPTVTEVSLEDEKPFEYQFFVLIAQSFPSMKQLRIINSKAQYDKKFMKSNNDNQTLPVIKYPNLTFLDFRYSHDDYIELFLLDGVTSLPNNLRLRVPYESLERVTNNFTRSTTRNHCKKVSSLHLNMTIEIYEQIKNYFPHIHLE